MGVLPGPLDETVSALPDMLAVMQVAFCRLYLHCGFPEALAWLGLLAVWQCECAPLLSCRREPLEE
jgi:hypothetical protein